MTNTLFGNYFQRFLVAIVAAQLFVGPISSFAQSKLSPPAASVPPLPYEEKTSPQPGRQIPPLKLPRQLTRAEKTQLAATSRLAMSLSEKSDDSFRRGLLPLSDHLRQLMLSYSLRQNVASFGVGETRESLNAQELARYQGMLRQLEAFNQPASEGWAGDLALAQVYLARVEAESAYLAGEQGILTAALSRQVEWSKRHFEAGRFDESLGMATPLAVIEAAQLERRAGLDALPRFPTRSEFREAFQDYRDQLQGMADQVERWSAQGAGIGRIDRLYHVRFDLAQADAVLGSINENDSARRTALKTAETELDALYHSQQHFYSRGTADVFDLACTWSDRQSIYDQAADLKGFRSKESIAAHARDFAQLQNLAEQNRNRGGRITADVEFVSALKAEQEIAQLRNSIIDPFRGEGR